MAGALGFEPRMPVPKTSALPLGYAPIIEIKIIDTSYNLRIPILTRLKVEKISKFIKSLHIKIIMMS